jgi:Ni,Fe-hydrogenase I cytochrome b subunit
MSFPLSLSDISLWLATTSIILLATSELLIALPRYASRIGIEIGKIRLLALGCGLAFLVTVVMRLFFPF